MITRKKKFVIKIQESLENGFVMVFILNLEMGNCMMNENKT